MPGSVSHYKGRHTCMYIFMIDHGNFDNSSRQRYMHFCEFSINNLPRKYAKHCCDKRIRILMWLDHSIIHVRKCLYSHAEMIPFRFWEHQPSKLFCNKMSQIVSLYIIDSYSWSIYSLLGLTPLGSRLWYLTVSLSLSHFVSWVRCGTWLYRFLIFAPLLTFSLG